MIDLVIAGPRPWADLCADERRALGRGPDVFQRALRGMIAFNFYEPLAKLIDSTGINWGFSDTLCLLGLFCISVVLLRMTTETHRAGHGPVPHAGLSCRPVRLRPGGGVRHHGDRHPGVPRAPVHKKIFKASTTTRKPPFGLGLDHQWLGFFQYETGDAFAQYGAGQRDPFSDFGNRRTG